MYKLQCKLKDDKMLSAGNVKSYRTAEKITFSFN